MLENTVKVTKVLRVTIIWDLLVLKPTASLLDGETYSC